jgi:uncharacterized protein
MLSRLAFPIALALALLGAVAAQAQVAPTADEVARYEGLHAAAHAGNVARIRSLAVNSSNLNPRDDHGRTPLHVATFARQRGAIQALARAGANLNLLDDDRYDAVTIAAVANDEETLRLLLSMGASARQVTSPYDGTALIAAAHLGHVGVVRQLIAAGAPVNHVNNLHWTAAIEAIVLGDGGPRHRATLQALIRARANLKLTDREGRTPLQLAKERGYAEMVKMLEDARAR